MSTDSTPEKLKIKLTDRSPVTITKALWPTKAEARWKTCDNQYEFQANRTWEAFVKVRTHKDGRCLVYGGYTHTSCFQGEHDVSTYAGFLMSSSDGVIEAVHKVIRLINDIAAMDEVAALANQCIAELPAVNID
jgi:hypothetical protein